MTVYQYGIEGSATEVPFCENHVNEIFPTLLRYSIIEKRDEAPECAACAQWPELAAITAEA